MGTMAAFPGYFGVLCLYFGPVWYSLKVLPQVFLYCIRAQEQRRRNWPFTSCYSWWRKRLPHSLATARMKRCTCLFVPVDSTTTLKYSRVLAGKTKVFKPPAAVMQGFLWSRTEMSESTWVQFCFFFSFQFEFCIQSEQGYHADRDWPCAASFCRGTEMT